MSNNVLDTSEFDELYSQIAPKQGGSGDGEGGDGARDKMQRIWFNAPPNYGRVTFVPVMDQETKKKLWLFLDYVMQVKVYNPQADDDQWVRILQKDMYGTLTDEESALYDEVRSLHETVRKGVGGNKDIPFKRKNGWVMNHQQIKLANYAIIFGKVLKHENPQQKTIAETKKEISMLIFPSRGMKGAIDKSIADVEGMGVLGSRQDFMPRIYSDANTGRQGFVQVNFVQKADGGFGFDVSVVHSINMDGKIVPSDFEVTESDRESAKNLAIKFIGGAYDYENKKMFKKSIFEAVKKHLLEVIAHTESSNKPQTEAPSAPAQTASVDPMLDQPSAPAATVPPASVPSTDALPPSNSPYMAPPLPPVQ